MFAQQFFQVLPFFLEILYLPLVHNKIIPFLLFDLLSLLDHLYHSIQVHLCVICSAMHKSIFHNYLLFLSILVCHPFLVYQVHQVNLSDQDLPFDL